MNIPVLKQALCGSGANLHRETKSVQPAHSDPLASSLPFQLSGVNCPASFYYVLVPGLVSVSSSCCYLLSSETKDRLPRVWTCIVMAELQAQMAL